MKVAIITASAMIKTINDVKYSGKCITGLDLDSNRIVRFVQNRQGAPIGNPFCNNFCPLNVYSVQLVERCPLKCQTENVMVDYRGAICEGKYEGGIDALYKRFQKINYDDCSFMLDSRYKLMDVSQFKHSLELIKASDIHIQIDGKTIGSFMYRGKRFRFMRVTDPAYRGTERNMNEAYLAISLPSDDHEGQGYFKFIAAIYPIV